MKENYIYPIKMYKADGMYEAIIPDFDDTVICGENESEIIESAQTTIALYIIDKENKCDDIPEASTIDELKVEQNESIIYIHVWMPLFRNRSKEIYVKKTLTIPQWLDILAKEKELNFSAVLVRGLKEELGINTNSER